MTSKRTVVVVHVVPERELRWDVMSLALAC